MINFTLPFSEISPINHPKFGLCAGFRRRAWFDKSLLSPSAPLWPCLASEVAPKEGLCQTDILVMGSVHFKADMRKRETGTLAHIYIYVAHINLENVQKEVRQDMYIINKY